MLTFLIILPFAFGQCTGKCTAGYYCNAGSESRIQNVCGGSDVYCPSGSSTPIKVQTGYYSTGGRWPSLRTGESNCTTGYWCTNGEQNLCPAG